MHFCTGTLLHPAIANRGPLPPAVSCLLSEFPGFYVGFVWCGFVCFCGLWVLFVCFSFPGSKFKKIYLFQDHASGSPVEFCTLPNLHYMLPAIFSQALVSLLGKTNQMHIFLKIYCQSIISKKHQQETHLAVLTKEHFLFLLFPFVTLQNLLILRGLVSSNHYVTVLTEVNKT